MHHISIVDKAEIANVQHPTHRLGASAKAWPGSVRSDFAAPRSAVIAASARKRATLTDLPHLSERSERSSRSE